MKNSRFGLYDDIHFGLQYKMWLFSKHKKWKQQGTFSSNFQYRQWESEKESGMGLQFRI